jgi:arginyl-tRNA synthetase
VLGLTREPDAEAFGLASGSPLKRSAEACFSTLPSPEPADSSAGIQGDFYTKVGKIMLRELVREKLQEAIQKLYGVSDQISSGLITVPEKPEFGDLSSTLAFALKERLKRAPREIAEEIVSALDKSPCERVEVVGPGFINFFFKPETIYQAFQAILAQGSEYGKLCLGQGKRAQVEFVSANPTGPLTVGHCRQAVLGDVICRLLENAGYDVTREYYYNDAGRQMKLLGESVQARLLEILGKPSQFPEEGYQGEYIREIARELVDQYGKYDPWQWKVEDFTKWAEARIFQQIRDTLRRLRLSSRQTPGDAFDVYYNEKWMYGLFFDEQDKQRVINLHKQFSNLYPKDFPVPVTNEDILRWLGEIGLTYEKDGALWFRATALGRPQDRVLVRSHTGEPTYRLPDMAYHANKLLRGFDVIVDIFGADHQETYQDVLAAVRALWEHGKLPKECTPDKIRVLIHQWVNLVRGGQPVKMSKRMATFVTIDELIEELKSTVELAHGQDDAAREDFAINAVRYFLLMRSADSHVNFDLDVAKQQSKENPVYYVMYAYTRIKSIFAQAPPGQASLGIHLRQPLAGEGEQFRQSLVAPEELALIKKLDEFPQIVQDATEHLAPHFIALYAHELAGLFHDFYEKHRVLDEANPALARARLALCRAVQLVLERAFALLGLVAPERM